MCFQRTFGVRHLRSPADSRIERVTRPARLPRADGNRFALKSANWQGA
ncbi:hypothetical protein [Streptomyces sp. NPDC001948]